MNYLDPQTFMCLKAASMTQQKFRHDDATRMMLVIEYRKNAICWVHEPPTKEIIEWIV